MRWTRGLRTQRAWMYIPDDPRLRKLADGIAEERRHSLFKRRRADDEDGFDQVDGAAPAETGDEEQLSLFQAMSAVATGVEDAGDPDGDDADSPEELVWHDEDGDESLEIALPPRPRRATGVVVGRDTSLAETKSKLRKDNAALVAHLVAVTGRSHREVNGELNRLAGVNKVTEATADQLQRRLVAGERWVRTL